MFEALIEWLKENVDSETITVNILEDNKYQFGEENQSFETKTFIQELCKYNFGFNGGNHREFYISIYDFETGEKELDLTFQVRPSEYTQELNLL